MKKSEQKALLLDVKQGNLRKLLRDPSREVSSEEFEQEVKREAQQRKARGETVDLGEKPVDWVNDFYGSLFGRGMKHISCIASN